jgi:hypothetical protein
MCKVTADALAPLVDLHRRHLKVARPRTVPNGALQPLCNASHLIISRSDTRYDFPRELSKPVGLTITARKQIR